LSVPEEQVEILESFCQEKTLLDIVLSTSNLSIEVLTSGRIEHNRNKLQSDQSARTQGVFSLNTYLTLVRSEFVAPSQTCQIIVIFFVTCHRSLGLKISPFYSTWDYSRFFLLSPKTCNISFQLNDGNTVYSDASYISFYQLLVIFSVISHINFYYH
jgi:hypothetical protein